jgi:hypothetical protein
LTRPEPPMTFEPDVRDRAGGLFSCRRRHEWPTT